MHDFRDTGIRPFEGEKSSHGRDTAGV